MPRGRVIEIYGPESSGKTTLCLHIIAEAQKLGGICAFVDMEHALDPSYAHKLGVDIDNLYISQPDTGEQALEIAEALIRSGTMDLVVVDSVAALVPRAEIEGEMGDNHPGLQARLMSQALRKLSGVIKQTNTVTIFTNQIRHKIGIMFGNPETTSGGNALKFYASVRLDIRSIQAIKTGGDGNIAVHMPAPENEGVAGVIAQVLTLLTGAAADNGFQGMRGRFKRQGLLSFAQHREGEAIIFKRLDNNARVGVTLDVSLIPADPAQGERLIAILQDCADASQQAAFADAWQDRVRRLLLEFSGDPRVIRVTPMN